MILHLLLWVFVIPAAVVLVILYAFYRFSPACADRGDVGFWKWVREEWITWRDRPRGPGPDPAPAGNGLESGREHGVYVSAPPASPPALPPPPAALPPPADPRGNGSRSVGGAQSDLLYALQGLMHRALNDDVLGKLMAMATLSPALAELGSALGQFGRALAEQGQEYGPEVSEPTVHAGAQVAAAGMQLADAEAALRILVNKTVAELTESGQRAPHSSQFNGGNQ